MPPVVILHGLFGDSGNWKQQARLLAPQRRVLCMDLRNHGLSPHADDMTFPLMAQDVIATLDHHEIPVCDLVGHSLGGKTGMQLATDHPLRIRRLVTVDIAPVAYPPHHVPIIQALKSLALTAIKSRTDADTHLSEAIPDAGVRQFLLKSLARVPQSDTDNSTTDDHKSARWEWRFNLDSIANCYSTIAAAPTLHGRFDRPHLVISGGRSDYVTADNSDSFLTALPQTSVATLKDAGHWPHSSHSQLFFEHLSGFLAAPL